MQRSLMRVCLAIAVRLRVCFAPRGAQALALGERPRGLGMLTASRRQGLDVRRAVGNRLQVCSGRLLCTIGSLLLRRRGLVALGGLGRFGLRMPHGIVRVEQRLCEPRAFQALIERCDGIALGFDTRQRRFRRDVLAERGVGLGGCLIRRRGRVQQRLRVAGRRVQLGVMGTRRLDAGK